MRLKNNTILLQISESDRDNIFKQEIKLADGSNMFIMKEIEAQFGEDRFFSQTVGIGKVLQVSDDVTNIKVGDIAVIQNTVDSNPRIVVEKGDGYKNVIIQANHSYHTDSYFAPPSEDRRGGWVYKKGGLNEASFITVLVRDGNFVSINNIIIVKHSNEMHNAMNTGIQVLRTMDNLATRTVLSAPEGSGYQHGDLLMVKDNIIGMFDMAGKLFEYFDTEDVLLYKKMNKK